MRGASNLLHLKQHGNLCPTASSKYPLHKTFSPSLSSILSFPSMHILHCANRPFVCPSIHRSSSWFLLPLTPSCLFHLSMSFSSSFFFSEYRAYSLASDISCRDKPLMHDSSLVFLFLLCDCGSSSSDSAFSSSLLLRIFSKFFFIELILEVQTFSTLSFFFLGLVSTITIISSSLDSFASPSNISRTNISAVTPSFFILGPIV
mmetsp:Transcript_61721/g.72131  ORF Transcript_61721/g.72131 Transcript_61721/m.72131 type:complete len:204 (-) Transcript_61721:221-832(-)